MYKIRGVTAAEMWAMPKTVRETILKQLSDLHMSVNSPKDIDKS